MSEILAVLLGGGVVANREIIISSGGSTAVNTAITTLNGLGGGVVRLDGLIEMDGDINMASNVTLMGYGPGTGLTNNTANAYDINFVATPTWYNITGLFAGTATATCDTAAEASNFTAGDCIMIKDDATADRLVYFSRIKVSGVPATGVVEMFDCPDTAFNNASTAAPFTSATSISGSGLFFMDITNAAGGSLEIDIDAAHSLTFSYCRFQESFITLNQCGWVSIEDCHFESIDNASLTNQVSFNQWVFGTSIDNCTFNGGVNSIAMNGTKAVMDVNINGCEFRGCRYGVCVTEGANTSRTESINITGCKFYGPGAHGGGTPRGIKTDSGGSQRWNVSGCEFDQQWSNAIYVNPGTYSYYWSILSNFAKSAVYIYQPTYCSVAGNYFYQQVFQIEGGSWGGQITGNYFGTTYLYGDAGKAIEDTSFTGNRCGALYINSTAAKPCLRTVISGNNIEGVLTFNNDSTDCVITGNYINGNVAFGAAVGDLHTNMNFSMNNVNGTVTFAEDTQNYCVVVGNTTNGAITDISDGTGGGTGNVLVHNTVY